MTDDGAFIIPDRPTLSVMPESIGISLPPEVELPGQWMYSNGDGRVVAPYSWERSIFATPGEDGYTNWVRYYPEDLLKQ